MKYIAIVDDDFIKNFRVDRDSAGQVLVVNDESGVNRGIALKPIIRPTVTFQSGESLYLTQGHIDSLLDYEKRQALKETLERVNATMESVQVGSVYRNESCSRKNHCYDYKGWHCAGCNGNDEDIGTCDNCKNNAGLPHNNGTDKYSGKCAGCVAKSNWEANK